METISSIPLFSMLPIGALSKINDKLVAEIYPAQRKIIEKRADDDLETIIKRYDTYMDTTKPVLNFYSKNSNFYELDGSSKIEEITAKIDNFLNV